jgi:hypothetical protein
MKMGASDISFSPSSYGESWKNAHLTRIVPHCGCGAHISGARLADEEHGGQRGLSGGSIVLASEQRWWSTWCVWCSVVTTTGGSWRKTDGAVDERLYIRLHSLCAVDISAA